MYTEYLANPLVLALAKITALLLLALAGALLIKRPAARATLLTCAMIASPLILVLSFTRPLLDIIPANTTPQKVTTQLEHTTIPNAEYREPSGTHTPPELPANIVTPSSVPHNTIPEPELPKSNTPEPSTHTSVIYAVCATGTIIMLLPLLISSWKILRLKTSPASGRPLEIWNNICQPIRKQYRLLFTSSPSAPFAHGIVHPKVLLPNKSTKWSDQKLHATLTHEAAHLHRRDPLTRITSFLVRAIFWFHPLVWIAHRQLIQAQEESCDQIALSSGIAAEDYAEELLASASHATRTPQDALAMARWSQMGKRIHRIINQPTNNTTTMKTTLTIATVTAITALILATTGVAQEQSTENNPAVVQKNAKNQAEAKQEAVKWISDIYRFENINADNIDRVRLLNFTNHKHTVREAIRDIRPSEFRLLKHFKNLRHLDLSSQSNINNESIGFLKQINLEGLDLFSTPVNDKMLSNLAESENLKYLRMGFNNEVSSECIGSITKMTNLEKLMLPGMNFPATKLTQLSRLSRLKELRVDDCTSLDSKSYSMFATFKALETLWIGCDSLDKEALESLSSLKQLKTLNINCTDKGQASATNLEELRKRLPACEINMRYFSCYPSWVYVEFDE